jgi:VIT1/CCC1 family predicted Fe2+/Mn2+ transporter
MTSSFDKAQHIREEHGISMVSSHLKEVVYAGTDGIVTTFAVVAGFAGVNINPTSALPIMTVLLFGLANLFADGLSMGLGDFLSQRAENEMFNYHKGIELDEIKTNPDHEAKETIDLLVEKGFSKTDAIDLTKIYQKNPEYWAEFMMKYELDMHNPETSSPAKSGLITFFAFASFGFLPIMPYLIFATPKTAFFSACTMSIIALAILGAFRAKVANQKLTRSIAETLLVGSLAGITAYLVGILFG